MNKTCPNCGVRFQRETGEEVGGMSVSIVILGLIFVIGYPLIELSTDWELWVHFAIWLPFSIIFPVLFYRYSRALWVVFLYVTDAIHPDQNPFNDTELTIIDAFNYRPEPTSSEDESGTD